MHYHSLFYYSKVVIKSQKAVHLIAIISCDKEIGFVIKAGLIRQQHSACLFLGYSID